MRIAKFILIGTAFSVMTATYAQTTTDPSVLKKQIKELESNIKDQYSEIEKLEKSIATARPEAEQAKRDAENIKVRYDKVKADSDAFNYNEKTAALKNMKKESSALDKSLTKYEKTGVKLDANLKEVQASKAVSTAQQANVIKELDELGPKINGISKEQKDVHAKNMKDKSATEVAKKEANDYQNDLKRYNTLEKENATYQKTIEKSQAKEIEAQHDFTTNQVAIDQTRSQRDSLQSAVTLREAELKQYDPKAVEKELAGLQKDLNAAQIKSETLQNSLDQTLHNINSKHDLIEKEKVQLREKQAELDKK